MTDENEPDLAGPVEDGPTVAPGGGPLAGNRRGWGLHRRILAPDSFGVLLVLIFATLVLTAALGHQDSGHVRLSSQLLVALTALFALHTSGAPRRVFYGFLVAAPLALLAVAVILAFFPRVGEFLVSLLLMLLVLVTIASIAFRVVRQGAISGSTVLAALCTYLLIGFLFLGVFGVCASVSEPTEPFIMDNGSKVQAQDAGDIELMYFSYVTVTTVGYGDVVMIQDLPRMIAASEALVGQLYLVGVVALIVGNFGRSHQVGGRLRRRKDGDDPPAQE
jgi:hypothetical protein